MKTEIHRGVVALSAAAILISSVSCYPSYPAQNAYAAHQDSKGYSVPGDYTPPAPRGQVDPAVAVAGVAAAGLLGYAIGTHRSHHHREAYYRPTYYRAVPYGYGGGHPHRYR